jgi:hypothetical protein
MFLEAFQVRLAQAFGAQGHSRHEAFPNVIRMVAGVRLDPSPIVTVRHELENTMNTIFKSTGRADGGILVKPS